MKKVRKIYTAIMLIFIILFFVAFNIRFDHVDDPPLSSKVCDFEQSSCVKRTKMGRFVLNANPSRIKSETEVNFKLTSKNHSLIKIKSAWLEGKDMYMGKIPLFFEANEQGFIADSMIGACTDDSMVWQMVVNIEKNNITQKLTFDFVSYR